MPTTIEDRFAPSYAQARAKFLAAAAAAGLAVQSHPHPLPGHDGEALAMDVVRAGPEDAPAVLLLTSGCHGVEGFCGSGVQGAVLADAALRRTALAAGVEIVLVHALNPWGFSHWRRVTEDSVDLNRNFQDFGRPLPRNPGYDEVAHLVVPDDWPPPPAVQQAVTDFIARRGARAWQAALSAGQYHHREGLFYGGQAPTWSQRTLREVLRAHGRRCRRLGWIDVHTGLGPSGVGERIFAGPDDAAVLARARAWWGPAVTSIYDGSSTSALLTGMMFNAALQECAQAEYTGIAIEYGTLPIAEITDALRADHWMARHPDKADAATRAAIRQRMRDAFFTDTPEWKARIVEQALDAMRQGIAGLARASS
jgi:hypothetical protein